MSRPVTLNDLRGREQAARGGNRGAPRNGPNGALGGALFNGMDGVESDVEPRKESYFDMWKFTFCPNFTLKSFTFTLVAIQLFIFIVTLVFTIMTDKGLSEYLFLGIQPKILEDFGLRMPWKIRKEFEIYRLLMPTLLNYGIASLFTSMIIELILGFLIEAIMGPIRLSLLFLISSIGGAMFGCMLVDKYTVGAEPAIFGFFGALIGIFIIYWNHIGQDFGRKVCLLIIMVFILVLAFLFLMGQAAQNQKFATVYSLASPDTFGSMGGFLFGHFSSWFLLPHPDGQSFSKTNKREKIFAIIGLALTAALFVLSTSFVFFGKEPQQYWSLQTEV